MAQTAIPNVSLLETITRGGPLVTEPSPAAKAYFGEKLSAVRSKPGARSTFFDNAFLPWLSAFENPREWSSYADQIATRHVEYGATQILLDAHGVPGSVQNNPNDPQNGLRLDRFKPAYMQDVLYENRDEFTPITIDTREILRLMQEGGPDSTNVSNFVSAQLTMAVNADRAREFHTIMSAIAVAAREPNLYHVQVPDIRDLDATEAQGRAFATAIRTVVKSLADFTNWYSPAGTTQSVPKDQARLIIRTSVMQLLGSLAYSTAFNPEYVFALPESQIVEIPDHYWDRNPGLSDQFAILVDAGTDTKYGSVVIVDTYHDWGVDAFNIKSSENRALHHSSILGTNRYKTFITVGVGQGTNYVNPAIVPATVTGAVYGPDGDIANGGALKRGTVYSTIGSVLTSDNLPAGGWTVEISSTQSSATGSTNLGLYNDLKIGLDDAATGISLVFKSILDPTKTVTRTYTLTGPVVAQDGSGTLVTTSAAPTFTGGNITYTTATGEVVEISADGGQTWNAAGASPIAVASGQTRYLRKRTAAGYVYPDGTGVHQYGPFTTP